MPKAERAERVACNHDPLPDLLRPPCPLCAHSALKSARPSLKSAHNAPAKCSLCARPSANAKPRPGPLPPPLPTPISRRRESRNPLPRSLLLPIVKYVTFDRCAMLTITPTMST